MRSTLSTLLALLLVAGGLTYWLLKADAVRPPTDNQATQQTPSQPTGATTTPTNGARVAASEQPIERLDTAPSKDHRPHAADATWADIQVVDTAGAPIPNATIHWYDDKAGGLLEANLELDGVERMMIFRQPCELARRHGWMVQADANGKARITMFDPTYVAGTAPNLFGYIELDPSTPTPDGCHRLVLAPDSNLTLLVLDEQDQPCSGVPVTLAVLDEDAALLGNYGLNAMARTNDDGIAVIKHLLEWRRLMFDNPEFANVPRQANAFLMLPQHNEPGPMIDLVNPPTDTVVLRMPTCGTVKARVELPGLPRVNNHEMVLTGDSSSRFNGYVVKLPADDGWTWFRYVPIQKRFRVNSLAARNIGEEFDGPAARGDVVEVVISQPKNVIFLRVHMVDHDGEPVAKKVLTAKLKGQHVRTYTQFTTDDNGDALLSMPFDPEADLVAIESGTINVIGASTGYGTATIKPMALRPGVFDLGDLVLERGKLVAAGRLMAGSEPYIKPISVAVQTFQATAEPPPPRWRTVHKCVATIAGGRFEVHAKLPAGEHRLYFHGLHNQPVEPVPFRIGQQDLVVQIPVGHAVSASYLLPGGIDADDVQCRLVPTAAVGPISNSLAERLQSYPDRIQGERCAVRWHGLPAGTYSLELSLWAQPKPMVVIKDIAVPPPPAGDARLIDIDLRKLVQVVTVNLLDPNGKPLDGYGALFSPEQMVAGKWRGHSVFGTTTRLLLPPGPVDLVAAIEGYQQAPVRGAGPQLIVRMFPWPTVTFRLAEPPKLPGKLKVLMQLEGTTKVDESWFGPNSEDSLAALVGSEFRPWPLENNKLRLQIGDGAHRLRIFVGTMRRFVEVEGATPTQVLPTERNVMVTVPQASWQAAIDAIGK